MTVYIERHSCQLVMHTCGSCGIVFGLERSHYERLLESHESFYCPNGHYRYFSGLSEAEKQRRRAEQAEARERTAREECEYIERRRRAAVGQLTKTKNRIKAGVCPFCNNTFTDVARHMESKHKDGEV